MEVDPLLAGSGAPPAGAAERGSILRWVGPILVLATIVAAGWALHHELRQVHYRDLVHQFHSLSGTRIAQAIGLTLGAYAVLSGYDFIALRAIGKPIAAHRILFSSFIANKPIVNVATT